MRSQEREMGQMVMTPRALGLRLATTVILITCLEDEHEKESRKDDLRNPEVGWKLVDK